MNEDVTQPSTNQTQPTRQVAGFEPNEFIGQLSNELVKQSGIISSSNSQLEDSIQRAIGGVRRATESTANRIESNYQRERGYMEADADQNMTTFLEGRGGYATQMPALRKLVETTDRELKDLAMRKEELLMANDAAGASKIADLELQSIRFRQEAEQQVFANLLGMANFGLSAASEQRQARAQSFQERSQIAGIGLEFGIEVGPNDTLEDVVTRAAPMASAQRRAELARVVAETNRANAETNRIISQAQRDNRIASSDPEALARAALVRPEILELISDVDLYGKVAQKMEQFAFDDVQFGYLSEIEAGRKSKAVALNELKTRTDLSAQQRINLINSVQKAKEPERQPSRLRQRLSQIRPSQTGASWEDL